MPAVVFPTLLQIRARVRMFLDEATQANFTDANINWAINVAQQEVATEVSMADEKFFVNPTPTVITIISGTRTYPLAADFWALTRMEDVTTGLRLDFGDFANMDNFSQNAIPPIIAFNNAGYGVSLLGNSVALTPTPSASGSQIQYWYVPILPDMTSDSDTSQIPRPFTDLLAIQAAIDLMIEDEADTSALERKYSRRFNQLIRATRNRNQQSPKFVTRANESNSMLI